MAEQTTRIEQPGRQKIDIEDYNEVRNWGRAFSVTPTELKTAIETVGPMAVDVERFVSQRQKT
jgi:hypothetical protein